MNHFPAGLAFNCIQCIGNMKECNSRNAKNVTCVTGKDMCAKLVMSKDGKEYGIYGCASYRDCMAAKDSCLAVERDNARATCRSECCSTPSCNAPPAKGILRLFVLTFKLILLLLISL